MAKNGALFGLIFVISLSIPLSLAQLVPSEARILFRLRQMIEFPPILQHWNRSTEFCNDSVSPFLTVLCSENRVTQFVLIGNKSSTSVSAMNFTATEQTLSQSFSSDAFFTTITKLTSLKSLSLVSLGLWGPIPTKIDRLKSLELLNLSKNYFFGDIPSTITNLKSLKSVALAENSLNGSVPDLTKLGNLEELDLGRNLLGPEFPSLGTKIVNLVLKNNSFRSQIPSTIARFDRLQRLDVSNNEFNGVVPDALFALPEINQLNLAGNALSGALSMESQCSERLEFVDLSNNLLTGGMPMCLNSNSSRRTVLFSGNCLMAGEIDYQHPASFCHEKPLSVMPPIQLEKKNGKPKPKLGLIFGAVGAVVGGVAVLVLLVLAVVPRLRRRKTPNKAVRTISISNKASVDARLAPTDTSLGVLGLLPYHIFSFEDIEDATNSFEQSNLMEDGSHGQLYKGWLRDGSMVVVRCLQLKQARSHQSLARAMESISKLQHQNLVSIVGHCIGSEVQEPNNKASNMFLVYEYTSNYTLKSLLTGKWNRTINSVLLLVYGSVHNYLLISLAEQRRQDPLKWQQRMSIITGVAKGLQFLHTGTSPGMFGNDLKVENIMLDDNLSTKINSYRLPLVSLIGSACSGPLRSGELNYPTHGEKEDIYQLGIVLLEVVTGKLITSQSELEVKITQLQQSLTGSPSKLRELADVHGTFSLDSLRNTIEIAFNCLSKQPSERPSIENVLWNLQYSAQLQEGWTPNGESFSRQSYSSI
ncbi:hypothetical protein Syun_023738 [Stephania yunnanensis]|uniref:Protein kinase domain-containing protein n=1 Tax=Stephania yunnanensis TaxID=152371 RepID=A0AAP0I2G2_9MAGN